MVPVPHSASLPGTQMTKAAPIQLVLSDVDGTLVTSDKQLTPATTAAVKRLGEAGIGFAVTSGRPPRGMAMLVEPLELTTPIAAFNGGEFVTPELNVIETQDLPDVADRRDPRADVRQRVGRLGVRREPSGS